MHLKKFTQAALTLFSTLLLVTSCDDEASQFGLDVLPGDDKIVVKYIDTISVPKQQIMFNEERLPMNDVVYLGYFKDPLLGEMKASLFTDIHLIAGATPLDSLTFNSFVSLTLYLKADSIYSGTSTSKVAFDLYELSDSLKWAGNYTYKFYPDSFYNKNGTPIGSFEINPDSIKLGRVQVKLSNSFAEKFFKYNESQLSYVDTLISGICIVPREYTATGLIITANLNYTITTYPSTYIQLLYKYHKDSSTIDTASVVFGLSSTAPVNNEKKYLFPKANLIQYNYAAASVNSYLKTGVEDTVLYAMNLGGAKVKLDMTQLDNFPDKKRNAIAKAEIWLPYESGFYNSNYTNKTALRLFLDYPDTKAKYLDYLSLYTKVGKVSEIDTTNKVYKLDVTNFVQDYLNGTSKVKNLIVSAENSISLHHAIFSKNRKATLKIKYSTF